MLLVKIHIPLALPASALSGFLSMIECATKPVLIDIVKCHNGRCATSSCCIPTCLLVSVLNLKLMHAHNLFLKARHM